MNDDDIRARARAIAQKRYEAGEPLGWFEDLYAQANGDATTIPWANLAPNPNLMPWLDAHAVSGAGKRALVIGCGLGDDAEELARRGFATTGFDISPSAIGWCNERFAGGPVEYRLADLLNPPEEWSGAFDFVLEIYTLQSLPVDLRRIAIANVASFVAPGGQLLIIARGRDESEPEGTLPWPLTRSELRRSIADNIVEESFEDYMDASEPSVRRFRIVYRRT